jgi:hypothetical protein
VAVKRARPKDNGVLVHAAVLVIAAGVATFLWTREKEGGKPLVAGDVTVWPGRSEDVHHITYESKTRKVDLETKQDSAGRYLEGTVEKESGPPKHAADAGPPAKPPPPKTIVTLVSVTEGQKVLDALAPLKALRDVGKLGDDRLGEFGLTTPEATLTVDVGGTSRKLLVGSSAGASGDRYVKDPASGEVYAVKGDLLKDLDSADSRMLEHELHEWKDAEIKTATLTAGAKKRSLVRGGEGGKHFWADASTPDAQDETISNWITKLERLRPTEFVATAPGKREVVLRVDYAAGRALGFLELAKAPGDKGKADYFVTTERTRLPAKVTATTAEQVEQDLGGVLK